MAGAIHTMAGMLLIIIGIGAILTALTTIAITITTIRIDLIINRRIIDLRIISRRTHAHHKQVQEESAIRAISTIALVWS